MLFILVRESIYSPLLDMLSLGPDERWYGVGELKLPGCLLRTGRLADPAICDDGEVELGLTAYGREKLLVALLEAIAMESGRVSSPPNVLMLGSGECEGSCGGGRDSRS